MKADMSIEVERKNGKKVGVPAGFDEQETISALKHFLPAQAPLKDFVHHNTLHAFEHMKFHDAVRHASGMFGYKASLSLAEYRELYAAKQIRHDALEKAIADRKGLGDLDEWMKKVRLNDYPAAVLPRIGSLRSNWKREYRLDMDSQVHPLLFRILCSYLDQGISIWNFPVHHRGLLSSIRELERNSFISFFKTARARKLLQDNTACISSLLDIVVGDDTLFKQYLFDQQFAHQGWSGMVSVVEDHPYTLLDRKKVSLHDLIHLELLFEIDVLDFTFGPNWLPLKSVLSAKPVSLFAPIAPTEESEVLAIWQEALEWTYYEEVLAGLKNSPSGSQQQLPKTFQSVFCIDDRECAFRRHLELADPNCETFGTPGFFGVEFYFQPLNGKFYTKLCPAPMHPRYLIKEIGKRGKRGKDLHLTKHTHTLFRGWLISQTVGFLSAFKLFLNIFKPSLSPATATSFQHMDKVSRLTIEHKQGMADEHDLQVGFTIAEMTDRVEAVLKSIGLVGDFASLVYIIGHGSSSVNNPHYAAYDCGACCGRPGSVNARAFCFMANHPVVRHQLASRGLVIPSSTQFLGGLHDTTRDEIDFFDEENLSAENQLAHQKNKNAFLQALQLNAKERSRRFESAKARVSAEKILRHVQERSVSLFQPRPELNHATNALCIVGRRSLTKNIFLDRRAFMNSYNYKVDPAGKYLLNILSAAAPVCGGINLEYFFSRVDNQKLGAGTKLPHNVMGLIGVANGIDGDLRPGLPSQMIEVHDPIRLMVIVEHFPDVVLSTIRGSAETYQWFINDWVHLVVLHPESGDQYVFKDGNMLSVHLRNQYTPTSHDIIKLVESTSQNIPVHVILSNVS